MLSRLPLLFDISWGVLTEQLIVYFDRAWPIIIREARVSLEVLDLDFRIAKCLRDVICLLCFSILIMISTDTLQPRRFGLFPVRNSAFE